MEEILGLVFFSLTSEEGDFWSELLRSRDNARGDGLDLGDVVGGVVVSVVGELGEAVCDLPEDGVEGASNVHLVALELEAGRLAYAVDRSDQGRVAELVRNSDLIEVVVILVSFLLVGADRFESGGRGGVKWGGVSGGG